MDTEKRIWQFLVLNGLTAAGAAGLMGNLYAESGLIPDRMEMLCLTRMSQNGEKYNDKTYTAAVDCGRITRAGFLNPLPGKQYGYGLAQWTSPGRKGGLYDLAKSMGVSIGDLEMQLIYLMKELLASYKGVYNVLCAAKSVKEASDAVLTRFECPADCGAAVKAARASYGQKYYDKYKDMEVKEVGERQRVIDLANAQGANAGGRKYWSWWGYQTRVPWCQIFVSWIMANAGIPLVTYGKYENCQYAIDKMKEKGIWHPNGYRPKPGDIVYYDWGGDGTSDHVGIVVKVSGDAITVREGNKSDRVDNRVIAYNHKQIVGYASPKYAGDTVETEQEGECEVKLKRLVKGSKGNQVKTVQRILKELGYKGKDGKALSIDGDFGENTEYALIRFQKAKGFVPTSGKYGICAAGTWKLLVNAA